MSAVIVTVTSDLSFADFTTGGYDLLNRHTENKNRRQEKTELKKGRGIRVGYMAKSERNHFTYRNKHGHKGDFEDGAKNGGAIATLER